MIEPTIPPPITFRAMALRATVYIFSLAALIQCVLFIDANRQGGPDFSEVSFIEIAQAVILFACSSIMLYVRHHLRELPQACLLLWALFCASFVRENDRWLDNWLFDGAWQTLVTIIVIPTLFVVLNRRQQFVAEFHQLSNTFGFGLFAGGFLTTYVFSRLFGRGVLWEALMGENYLRVIKDAAEEISELAGYALLLFACIEILLYARRLCRVRKSADRG